MLYDNKECIEHREIEKPILNERGMDDEKRKKTRWNAEKRKMVMVNSRHNEKMLYMWLEGDTGGCVPIEEFNERYCYTNQNIMLFTIITTHSVCYNRRTHTLTARGEGEGYGVAKSELQNS